MACRRRQSSCGDEERIHIAAGDGGKSHRLIRPVYHNPEQGPRQVSARGGIDFLAVGRRQKIMGCVDGAAPNVDHAHNIARARPANREEIFDAACYLR